MRLSFVFIGFCTGCYKRKDPAPVEKIETSSLQTTTSAPKVLKEFSKHDYCYDFKNHTKIYTGHANTTRSGKPCLLWSNSSVTDSTTKLEKNYCRDPYNSNGRGVWCHCEDCGEDGTEDCDVPWCEGEFHRDCHQTGEGYSGKVNHTISGIPCQAWNVEWPQNVIKVPEDIDRTQTNFCSEAGGLGQAWCYKGIEVGPDESSWEFCNIVYNDTNCRTTDSSSSYYDYYYESNDSNDVF